MMNTFCLTIGIIVKLLCTYAICHSINRVADNLEAISSDFLELLANIEMKESEQMGKCEFESETGNCLINECMFEPSSLCDKVRLNIYKELENDLKNSVNLELYYLGRKDAIEEFAGVILCEIDNMGVQRTVLRVMEQLKEKQNEHNV